MSEIVTSILYIILFLLFPAVVGTLTAIFFLVSWMLIMEEL